MTRGELEQRLKLAIRRVAPDAEIESITPDTRLREDLEIDSFDFLQLVIGIHDATGIDVPEADYGKLATFGSAVEYLERALGGREAPSYPPSTSSG